jgi:hypothetical protein
LSQSDGCGRFRHTLDSYRAHAQPYPEWLNVTWPFASLLIGPTQAELRVYAVEPLRIARSEVIGLRWVHGPLGKGIKFQTESGRLNKVTVWPLGKAKKPLDELGWR